VRLRSGAHRGRPAGVPDSALSIGPRLRALAVYLAVFQHVPVERCRQLIADVTGAAVSDGFIHSCLATAASLAAEVVQLIRTLITAAAAAGFDETALRPGPAGNSKYVHGAFTEQYSAFWLGTRSLGSMQNAGILPGLAGVVVSGRYQSYFRPRRADIAGNQACLSHLLRDYQDGAGTHPGAVWPVQAQRALRGLIKAWHAAREQDLAAIPGDVLEPLAHEFRHAVLAGLASVPRVPGPKNSTKQRPGRELPEFCRDRRDDVLRCTTDTSIWPANNISERGVRPLKPSRRSPAAWPATTSPRTASASAATSAPPASTARTPRTSCSASCPAGPGARPQRRSPRSHHRAPAPPVTSRECLVSLDARQIGFA